MILIFGGTTEGRAAAKELEEAGSLYYYSTKGGEQQLALHHGVEISGAMEPPQIECFCKAHNIRLIVDAAHPFASQLHNNIALIASKLSISVIRFERIYPPRNPNIIWCNDFTDAIAKIEASKAKRLFSTAGVQSIPKLKSLADSGVEIYHRILNRESSISLAEKFGIEQSHICFYNSDEDDAEQIKQIAPDAILLKDSGLSGGYNEKAEAALKLGVKVFAVMRPPLPKGFITVNGQNGMRRMVERYLPEFFPLHSGLTTGSCATAAALAAAQKVMEGLEPTSVPLILPNGETIEVDTHFALSSESEPHNAISSSAAATTITVDAFVIKESGDDPDVTDKMEIHATVSKLKTSDIVIDGGNGVGRITLPGFDSPPGEAAINKAPRKMIEDNLRNRYPNQGFKVIISVPGGEEIARRTFNPRLGIEGGISIIGVSGIIKPFSDESFINSVRKCMEVAKATGSKRVVINSGAKSENYLKEYYRELTPQCFVQYGNKIGDTIAIANELGFSYITLGIMLGKAVKLAAGNLDTHSSNVTMDREFIASLLTAVGCPKEITEKAHTITLARELWDIVPAEKLQPFVNEVITRCKNICLPLCPNSLLTILLIDEDGKIHSLQESIS